MLGKLRVSRPRKHRIIHVSYMQDTPAGYKWLPLPAMDTMHLSVVECTSDTACPHRSKTLERFGPKAAGKS
jgi:hypothetical protein